MRETHTHTLGMGICVWLMNGSSTYWKSHFLMPCICWLPTRSMRLFRIIHIHQATLETGGFSGLGIEIAELSRRIRVYMQQNQRRHKAKQSNPLWRHTRQHKLGLFCMFIEECQSSLYRFSPFRRTFTWNFMQIVAMEVTFSLQSALQCDLSHGNTDVTFIRVSRMRFSVDCQLINIDSVVDWKKRLVTLLKRKSSNPL